MRSGRTAVPWLGPGAERSATGGTHGMDIAVPNSSYTGTAANTPHLGDLHESLFVRKDPPMKMTTHRTMAWHSVIGALALFALPLGFAQAAGVPSTTAHHFSSHPMIAGTVVTVNDRQMVVDTDQGQQVALELDSRTMAPRDLAPGMVMRAEFLALEDCRFYAQRIMPIRGGMSTNRFQAYANTHDSQESMAYNSTAMGDRRWGSSQSVASAGARVTTRQTIGEHSPGAVMTAVPGTADNGFSTRPMVSGRVITVNDHRLVVATEQGQEIAMVMDSRTMVPAEIEPGSELRAEFRQLNDGRYYASRISRIGSGTVSREQAYAHTLDSEILLAQNLPDCGFVNSPIQSTVTSASEQHGLLPSERVATLPQTASRRPLLLLVSLLALGGAGAVTVVRGLKIA